MDYYVYGSILPRRNTGPPWYRYRQNARTPQYSYRSPEYISFERSHLFLWGKRNGFYYNFFFPIKDLPNFLIGKDDEEGFLKLGEHTLSNINIVEITLPWSRYDWDIRKDLDNLCEIFPHIRDKGEQDKITTRLAQLRGAIGRGCAATRMFPNSLEGRRHKAIKARLEAMREEARQ